MIHPAAAVVLGWLALLMPYLAIAIVAAVSGEVAGSLTARVFLYQSGHMLLLALLCATPVWLWSKLAPPSTRRRSDLAIFVVALVVAAVVLPPDMTGFVGRQRAAGSAVPWAALIVVAAAFVLVVAANVRRLPLWLRLAAVVSALALAAVQRFVQPMDYLGAHAFVLWTAATAIAAAIVGTPLPARGSRASVGRRGVAIAVLWGLAITSILIPPSRSVRAQMSRSPAVPWISALSTLAISGPGGGMNADLGPWWQRRDEQPDIPPSDPPLLGPDAIVLLITVDALRADVVNSGKHDDALPTLAKLRDSSVSFIRARTPSPSSATSIVTIMSSLYYSQLYWTKNESKRWRGRVLAHRDESVRLPALLGEHEVRTVHLLANHGFDNSSGLSRGFEILRKTKSYSGPGDELMTMMLDELSNVGDGRLFVYAHFLEPHAPYTRAGRQGTPYERYLREIALVDKELARLLDFLEANHLVDRTLIVLSADHGEAFGEHGLNYHASSLYEELLRVPLLFHHPAIEPREVDANVGLVDLGPTVLDLMGLPTPGNFMGQSLVPFLRGQEASLTRPMAADSGRRMQSIILDGEIKVIVDLQRHTEEVYDLQADPGETNNLADDPSSDERLQTLRYFFDTHTLQRPGGYTPPPRRF